MNSKGTNYSRNKRALCHPTGFSTHLDLRGLQELGLVGNPACGVAALLLGTERGDAGFWADAISCFPGHWRGAQLTGDSEVLS